ncbi:MAG: NADH:ubiquinone reductase (Na(+)-transporting) subunit B [Bacteroidales bacterium]|nr:NADH:ubiquinone reductase (Na(+)-transporting) subunit B [Bacteroidales bacterium]
MKFLRNYIDKIKPNFVAGGKFEVLESTFDAVETFLFVPDEVTKPKGTQIRDAMDMKRSMILVMVALVPSLLFGMWNVGHWHFLAFGEDVTFLQKFGFGFLRMLPLIVVSYVVGLGIEIIFAQIRKHEVNEGYFVSGFLIPLIVPIDTPLWMLAVAVAFAVILGKEVFGGTGMNILNPALTVRAFLFFAYPGWMSGDFVWISGMVKHGDKVVDGFSGATPLAEAAAGNLGNLPSTMDMFLGVIPGSVGETSFLAIMIGAVILLWTGIGSWKIMASMFAGGLLMALTLNVFAVNPYMELPAWEHLLLGGFAFGAVFMATDPVTATQTEKGKWIYGFLTGVLAILIRVLNPAYPEGVMLAILFMNVFAPLIDHYVVEANIKKRLNRIKVKA